MIVPLALVVPRHDGENFGSPTSPFNVEIYPTYGLIDTGATITCITRSAVRRYHLVAKGKTTLGNVDGDSIHNTYGFRLAFYPEIVVDGTGVAWHVDHDITGPDVKHSTAYEVLIGMDIIGLCDLSVTRHGRFTVVLP